MNIEVTGRHIDTGESFRGSVKGQLEEMADKFNISPVDAHVVMAKLGNEFVCDLSVHTSHDTYVRCHGAGADAYLAFESAMHLLNTRLRKYKQRLIDSYRHKGSEVEQHKVAKYVLDANHSEEEHKSDEDLSPAVIAEMQTNIPNVSVADAVMHMDLSNEPVFVFRNLKHGGVNILYKRDDGNIGWIDARQ